MFSNLANQTWRSDARDLVQALTDRREDGPYAHFPLARWEVLGANQEGIVLQALITTRGQAGIDLRLWNRPGEAAERYGRLLARLWDGSLDGRTCEPEPGTLLTVHGDGNEVAVRGPARFDRYVTVEAVLRSDDMGMATDLFTRAYRTESTLIFAHWAADHEVSPDAYRAGSAVGER